MIPYGRQDIVEADIEAVIDILRSDFLTQGPMVPRFEAAVAAYCGASHAVAVNSATSALHVACLALELGPGDWLWTSPNTFVASANCGLYCGASVDFVDIDPRTYNLCPQRLAEKLEQAERAGRLPKVVVPVHYAGQPCDMPAIHALSQRYGFRILEDASHAIGARYGASAPTHAADGPRLQHQVGACAHSDITVFSFHPVKIITTGEGGMAVTGDPRLADRMRSYRSHGITSDPLQLQSRPENEIWNYQQLRLGFNYRMTDIAAALGLSQLSRLEDFLQRRRSIAKRYDEELKTWLVSAPWQLPGTRSSYHLYPIRVSQAHCGQTQRQVYDALLAGGIGANLHYIPVYRQPYYEQLGFPPGYCPHAEQFHRETISLPMFPAMTDAQHDEVLATLRALLA